MSMCFSAPASFVTGAVLTSAGIVTLKKVNQKKQIPLAMIPLLLGLQQIIEGFVWLSLSRSIAWLNLIATYSFVFFSHVLWPIFVPLAVFLVETVAWRKKAIMICGALGLIASSYLLFFVIFSPVNSQITCNSIRYFFYSPELPLPFHAIFYLTATCLTCLLSSHRIIRLLGLATFIFAGISYYFYVVTFASVWCFFSAILSLLIYLFFKQRKQAKAH